MFCSYCGQGFKRDEHLERHVLTHTDVRPFRCRDCKLTFKRKDLLRRHYKSIHAPPTEEENTQPDDDSALTRNSIAERISIACISCATSKTKCDNQAPCGRCVKKRLTCERRAFRRSSYKNPPQQPYTSANEVNGVRKEPFDSEQKETESQETDQESSNSPDSSDSSVHAGTDNISYHLHEPFLQHYGTDASADIALTHFPSSNEHSMLQDMYIDTFLAETPFHSRSSSANTNLPSSIAETFSDPLWSFVPGDPVSNPWGQWPPFGYSPSFEENKPKASMSSSNLTNLKVLNNPRIWSMGVKVSPSPQMDPSKSSCCWRDRLLALSQKVWVMAKESVVSSWSRPDEQNEEANAWMDHIILLPPAEVAEQFFQEYILYGHQRFHMLPLEEKFDLPAAVLDVENPLHAGIQILLIVAQSTRSSPNAEIRALSNGLAEVCRIVMQDVEFAVTSEFLDESLSLLQLMQWSGDPRHMNFVPKLWEQHAKIIRRDPPDSDHFSLRLEPLKSIETQSRMMYSWLAVDLELSIFQDAPPKLAVQDISTPSMSPMHLESQFTSLTTLFESFMEGHLTGRDAHALTPTNLRLLLHPLQCLSAHLHQCLNTFGSVQNAGFRSSQNSTLGLASKAFIDELETLLRRWHKLSASVEADPESEGVDPVTRSSLVLYHLMMLNNLASFQDIERLVYEIPMVRSSSTRTTKTWMRTTGPEPTARLLYHAGQCISALRCMPPVTRRLWWAAALYRVALILCQAVLSNHVSGSSFSTTFPTPTLLRPDSAIIILDREYCADNEEQDAPLQQFLRRLQGTPVLTRADGSPLFLLSAVDILEYCIQMLSDHMVYEGTEYVRGVMGKLCALRAKYCL